MKYLYGSALALLTVIAAPSVAQDVLVLGEIHDNPHHHAIQADRVGAFQPAAIVFEMLTPEQAARVTPGLIADRAALEDALNWSEGGWPDFAMYYPIFSAAPDAQIFGANVPGQNERGKMNRKLAQYFGQVGPAYGLDKPLAEDQQTAREALQMAAHCDALPAKALPSMVAFQRLRDAVLADAIQVAVAQTGGPVVVITGNGHARRDWGAPALLAEKYPEIDVKVIGQTEDDAPLEGGFDVVRSAPAIDRPDPCAAFKTSE